MMKSTVALEGLGNSTFTEIQEEEYQKLGGAMNIFNVKKDKTKKPVRAKSRIVVLGNLEKRVWEKGDRYAPVLSATSGRLLTSGQTLNFNGR